MKKLLLTMAAFSGMASVAAAGSPELAPPAPAPIAMAALNETSWDGFYVGGLVSFESGDASTFSSEVPIIFVPLEAVTAFGGFVGYNKQVNALVFGGELAYITGDVVLTGFPASIYTDRIDIKARAGYSFGSAMVYGVLGYSFADFYNGAELFANSGLNYGVGVDVMLTDRIFVGAEYLLRDLSGELGANRIDSNFNSAVIRAGFRF